MCNKIKNISVCIYTNNIIYLYFFCFPITEKSAGAERFRCKDVLMHFYNNYYNNHEINRRSDQINRTAIT